jgi:hypothetical protein
MDCTLVQSFDRLYACYRFVVALVVGCALVYKTRALCAGLLCWLVNPTFWVRDDVLCNIQVLVNVFFPDVDYDVSTYA